MNRIINTNMKTNMKIQSLLNKQMSYLINRQLIVNHANHNNVKGYNNNNNNDVAGATIENQSKQFHYEIGLGSINRMKIESVRKSFPSNYFVIPTKVLIPIPNPKTKIDTYQMAKYRTIVTRDIYPRLDLYVGIQYGMWKEESINLRINNNDSIDNNDDKWIGACVYLSNQNGDNIAIWTDLLTYNRNKDNTIVKNDDNDYDNVVVTVDSIESKLLQSVFKKYITFDYIERFIHEK